MWIPLVNGQQREMVPLSTWDNLGCRYIAYALEPLLVKPGLEVLLTQVSLAQYVGWPYQLILDVRRLQFNQHGDVVVCSPFDGAKIKVSGDQLALLIESLKPDKVVGITTGAARSERALQTSHVPEHFISERPLQMATKGEIFTETAIINITDSIHQTSTEVIQKNCRCEVCSLGLTKSYLFHLWCHVPGLCQRFLVQHNATVFFDCNSRQLSL